MSITFSSWKTVSLTAKLTSAATTLTADIDVWVTTGRLYFVNDLQEEWISFTWVSANGSYFDYTGLVRWLTQTGDPSVAWTGNTWWASNKGVLTQMHDQAFDRQRPTPITFATTAARDTALWADGAATDPWVNIYVTATWLHYNYNLSTAVWESVDTGTTTPNATESASGKIELPTDAEVTAKTATWWTGATVCPTNAQTGKSVSLKAVDATLDDTDHIVFDNAGTDNKMLVSVLRDQLATDTTKKGTVEKASSSETQLWTADKYADCNELKDYWGYDIVAWTTNTTASANTERSKTDDETFTKVKEIDIDLAWTYSLTIDMKESWIVWTAWDIETFWVLFYVNWSPVTSTFPWNMTDAYVTKTWNYTASAWDLLQIYYRTQSTAWLTAFVRNFQVKFDLQEKYIAKVTSTVNTD